MRDLLEVYNFGTILRIETSQSLKYELEKTEDAYDERDLYTNGNVTNQTPTRPDEIHLEGQYTLSTTFDMCGR